LAIESLEHRVNQVLKEREELQAGAMNQLRNALAIFKEDLAKGKSLDSCWCRLLQ